jgi:hypothetical protein
MWRAAVLATVLGGCGTAATLESAAMKHEARAERYRLEGDGVRAGEERDLATAAREEARLRRQSRNRYMQSEVFLF